MMNVSDFTFARQVTLPALRSRMGDERGATMVEYGLILAVVAVVALVGFTVLGDSTKDSVCDTAAALTTDAAILDDCTP